LQLAAKPTLPPRQVGLGRRLRAGRVGVAPLGRRHRGARRGRRRRRGWRRRRHLS